MITYQHYDENFTCTFEIAYRITPGDRGCRMTANGDGWPSSPDEYEFTSIECTEIESEWVGQKFKRTPGPVEASAIGEWFAGEIDCDDRLREQVEEACRKFELMR